MGEAVYGHLMNAQLSATPYYPFNLDGPLCPMLNDAEVLASFYADDSFRHSIKQFCKRTVWPAKPAVSYSVDPAQLKALLLSLLNSPVGRAALQRQSQTGRCPYLDNAIWQWLTTVNLALSRRLSDCCDDIKGRLFIRPAAWVTFLTKIQSEQPEEATVTQLAYLTLAFAMLQADDRYTLGEAFLAAFPDCKAKLLGNEVRFGEV